ncbi:arsenate reductase [Enterococcus sp. PF1-24]|uniref:arsenate reductase family protein n=1 Tax=unclassified Enterococcus TaxID=2608891 RepID=UPI0024767E0A|nr:MULTISPECIES: arsenate reductase family protein [unclassified Enterococcus]MDH6365376.1 arsenate reductase [Enterococcus sp. PFB1-1]MDH6402477.1 arsenate reductase [Enterococcus sp. PF1-24]
MYTLYWYPKCSTCQKAKKWLDAHGIEVTTVDFVATPPTVATVESWLKENDLPLRRFFNTSGMKYRELGLKDKIADFSLEEASQWLASDGMLIKRPLLTKGNQVLALGFKEADYQKLFS